MKIIIGMVVGGIISLGWIYLPPIIFLIFMGSLIVLIPVELRIRKYLRKKHVAKIECEKKQKRERNIKEIHRYLYRDYHECVSHSSINQGDFTFYYTNHPIAVKYKGSYIQFTPMIEMMMDGLLEEYATEFRKIRITREEEEQKKTEQLQKEAESIVHAKLTSA